MYDKNTMYQDKSPNLLHHTCCALSIQIFKNMLVYTVCVYCLACVKRHITVH